MKINVNVSDILLLVIITTVSWLFVISCDFYPNKSDIYGTYYADYDKHADKRVLKEKLVLKKDGTFVHEVTLKTSPKIYSTKGNWSFSQGDGCVHFDENLMHVIGNEGDLIPGFQHPQKGSTVCLPAEKIFGQLQLWAGDYLVYKKSG